MAAPIYIPFLVLSMILLPSFAPSQFHMHAKLGPEIRPSFDPLNLKSNKTRFETCCKVFFEILLEIFKHAQSTSQQLLEFESL